MFVYVTFSPFSGKKLFWNFSWSVILTCLLNLLIVFQSMPTMNATSLIKTFLPARWKQSRYLLNPFSSFLPPTSTKAVIKESLSSSGPQLASQVINSLWILFDFFTTGYLDYLYNLVMCSPHISSRIRFFIQITRAEYNHRMSPH